MNIEDIRAYCLSLPAATESMPFGEDTLVFKVSGKIFLLIGLSTADRFNVKCDPEKAAELRERSAAVRPGFHMNKKHWNTVYIDGSLSIKQLYAQIDHSYAEVIRSLPKKTQAEITAR